MTDLPGGDAAAAAIHSAFAKTVKYTGAGLANASIAAVRTHGGGDLFMEHQQNVNELAFEVRKASFSGTPGKGDTLIENNGDGAEWEIIEVIDKDEVDAWLLMVASA